MKKIPLGEILTAPVKTLPPHAPISKALEEMASMGISCIVAVDEDRRPLGIFTERDAIHLLAERRGPGSLKMADVMSAPPFTAPLDVDFREAYRMLQERGFRHLVVVDEQGCLLGIVSEGDFMHHLDVGDLSEFKVVEKIMTRNIATVDADDALADAISLMSRNRYSCVVVTREQALYGMLTERDVVRLAVSGVDGMTVGGVASTPLLTAPPGMALPEAIEYMDRHKIRHLVIAEDGRLLGLVTRHDLVKTLQGSYVNFLRETIQAQRAELFKLAQQRSLFKLHDAALSAAANTIVITDRQAVVQWANPAFSRLTGYTLEETVGKRTQELVKSGENGVEFYRTLWETILGGQVWHGEIVNKRKDGTLYQEEMTITPVCGEGGEITHFIAVKQDITERKKYEEELKRSNAELEQFSYAVSHDMRQPLRMITSYLQLIQMELGGQLDDEKCGYFNFAIDGAKRIDQMLVALLEYSRVGRMGEAPGWIDSRAVFDEALQYLQPAIAEAHAKLNVSGEWPRIMARHDEILRLLQNLIGNAVKYRVKGCMPEIAVTSQVSGDEWHLCVADNGVGIITDQIKRLFQVFQRLQPRDAYEGTGIGLALCRKIAEQHKGRIWAESAGEGRGSRFCVVLPVLPIRAVPARGGDT